MELTLGEVLMRNTLWYQLYCLSLLCGRDYRRSLTNRVLKESDNPNLTNDHTDTRESRNGSERVLYLVQSRSGLNIKINPERIRRSRLTTSWRFLTNISMNHWTLGSFCWSDAMVFLISERTIKSGSNRSV